MEKKIQSTEKRTAFVVIFSAVTMVIEIITGVASNSMALLADGIHMGAHVFAIGLSWGAYALIRYLSKKPQLNINSEKILSLSAFTSGILLLFFAVFVTIEAFERFFSENTHIQYTEALTVAIIGIIVNAICAFALHSDTHTDDINRHSAYLHVVSDVLTSVGAIIGLLCAMIWDIVWVDTAIAIITSAIIIRWAINILLKTSKTLVSN